MSAAGEELARIGRMARWLVPLFCLLAYLSSGVRRLELGEQGLRVTFGRAADHPLGPGIHYHLPWPFGRMVVRNVKRVRDVPLSHQGRKGAMLYFTGDENLVRIDGVVQYTIGDLARYSLHQAAPDTLVQELGVATLASEVATYPVDDVFTSRKVSLQDRVREGLQARLDALDAGVRVLSVNLTELSPPDAVARAFHEASAAREEGRKLVSEAHGYANHVIPRARGRARAILDEADASRAKAMDEAQARVQSFLALLEKYRAAPDITKKELYLEAMGRIGRRVGVLVDQDPTKSLYYLQNARAPQSAQTRRTPRTAGEAPGQAIPSADTAD